MQCDIFAGVEPEQRAEQNCDTSLGKSCYAPGGPCRAVTTSLGKPSPPEQRCYPDWRPFPCSRAVSCCGGIPQGLAGIPRAPLPPELQCLQVHCPALMKSVIGQTLEQEATASPLLSSGFPLSSRPCVHKPHLFHGPTPQPTLFLLVS